MAFHKVAKIEEIKPESSLRVKVQSLGILLISFEGQIYAIADECTHAGDSLFNAPVRGCEIECPSHGARFDIRNGKVLCMPATENLESFPVRINGNDVEVDI